MGFPLKRGTQRLISAAKTNAVYMPKDSLSGRKKRRATANSLRKERARFGGKSVRQGIISGGQ